MMSRLLAWGWLRRVGLAFATVLCLGAMTTGLSKPADARVFVGFSFGVPAWGFYGPAYYPGYYYRPYYAPYWRAGWRWRWCRWHPHRCGW
jgi:hypothetical protein